MNGDKSTKCYPNFTASKFVTTSNFLMKKKTPRRLLAHRRARGCQPPSEGGHCRCELVVSRRKLLLGTW
jgi:hypothetical protein